MEAGEASAAAREWFRAGQLANGRSANAEAIQYFRKWINQDRRRFAEFPAHPSAGLTAALRTYYRRLSIDEPRCATPAMAGALLAGAGG